MNLQKLQYTVGWRLVAALLLMPAVAQATKPPPVPAAAPMTDAEQRITRLGVRQQILHAIADACGNKFPAHAQQYKAAVQAWSSANKSVLDQAAMLMLTRSSRAEAKAVGPLIDAEKKVLQAWQVDTIGIPLQKAPAMADCDKITAGFASLP